MQKIPSPKSGTGLTYTRGTTLLAFGKPLISSTLRYSSLR